MNANVYVVIDPCSVCSFVKFMSKAEETSTLSTVKVSRARLYLPRSNLEPPPCWVASCDVPRGDGKDYFSILEGFIGGEYYYFIVHNII